ncbi:hypothetical protein B0O80DRAFT_432751 [Mortierella sp. GBAus27b]|nr:hypothetical protein BGX31_002745 [Mortierella sp. GBA43]KAI8363111.1 hypothetical protein B0O80DRAFT_432751 [Mortierella sp. GBAus27b]
MSAAALWEAFRTNPSADDLFTPRAHIVFLPTGAGASTDKQINEFYKAGGYTHAKKLHIEEKVIHRTVGESSAVDEVEVKAKFITGAGGWILPGIEPYHLADLTITFPMVICASFVENRIASVRYMWDNASVLKMVRLIGSRQSWPILAEAQIEALRDPSRVRLNPYGSIVTAGISTPRPQSMSNISQIFNTPPTSPTQVSSGPGKKGHPSQTSNIFSQQQQPTSPALNGSAKTKPHPSFTSSIFSQQSPTSPTPPPRTRPYSSSHTNIFGISPEERAKAKAEAEAVAKAKAEAEAAAAVAAASGPATPIPDGDDSQKPPTVDDAFDQDEANNATETKAAPPTKRIPAQEQPNGHRANKAPAPLSIPLPPAPIAAPAPVPAPPKQPPVRIHPNFRSSFTLG